LRVKFVIVVIRRVTAWFFRLVREMPLPPVGTAAHLEVLSPFIPDELIGSLLPRRAGAGRRGDWTAAQLFRTTLLLLLTPVRFSNALCHALPEQRAWRSFARLPHRLRTPTPRQLHEFRARLTPLILRQLNAQLVRQLLAQWPSEQPGIALIDATDLPAMTNEYKKSGCAFHGPAGGGGRTDHEDWANALVHRL
jgi:hypothetical protein